jgi:hypothetical protein
MDNRHISIKKITTLFLAAFAALVFIIWLFIYFTTSSITVKSEDSAATIQIKQTLDEGSSNANPYTNSAQHELSANLKKGSYEILVANKSSSISQFIEVKGHKKLSFTLNPPKTATPEPVYGGGAAGLLAEGSQLLFIDLAGNTLSKIDAQNNLTTLDRARQYVNVKWSNSSLGIALSKDNNLFIIQNGSPKPLSLPFSASDDTIISYDIAKDGTVYVGGKKAVYKGLPDGSFKQIYTANTNNPLVYAANNKVAIVDSSDDEDSIAVVDSSGKTSKKDIEASEAAWSPDGSKLLLSGDFGHKLFDSNLKEISTIRISAERVRWQNDHNLLYGIANQLWIYDTSNNRAQIIANMPSGLAGDGTVGDIFTTPDNSYVYVTSQKVDLTNKANQYQLFRVGLNNQTVPNFLNSLNIFLPETIDEACSLNFVNFIRPSITARFRQGTSGADCVNKAKAELQAYDLDPNNFSFNPQIVSVEGE